jgi:hypothetical protein
MPILNLIHLFESALEIVDNALMSATKAEKKTSKEADEAFEYAVSRLGYYEWKYHSKKIVVESMKEAEETDRSSMNSLNRLREYLKSRVREELMTLFHHTLTLIFSHWRRDRRRKSSFISTSPFRMKIPLLLYHVRADS